MISPDNVSISGLKRALFDAGGVETEEDESGCLRIHMQGKTFVLAVIGPHQLRFLVPTSVATSDNERQDHLLRIANELNSDLGTVAGAYVSDEGQLIYTHPLTVSGGVSEANIALALHEFAVEHAIFEKVVEGRLARGARGDA